MRQDVLVYHFHLATRRCECFSRFIKSSDYSFAMVETTNDLKALKVSDLKCPNLVNQGVQFVFLAAPDLVVVLDVDKIRAFQVQNLECF